MSLGNATENSTLLLFFNNTGFANVGDATGLRGSTTAGSFYLALHTADPGETGDQTTSECSYTGYARQAIARTSGGFTVTANEVVNAATVGSTWQRTDTAAAQVAQFWSLGVASAGASQIICYGYCGNINTRLAFTAKADDSITIPSHALIVDDRVVFFPTVGATLPSGMTEGTVYFVKTVSGNDITIAATSGGTVIDLTAVGAGFVGKVVGLSITQNVTPQFAVGTLKFDLD